MTDNQQVKQLTERLKSARESAGLSLENLAVLTKIQKKYLIYLEEGRYDKLPDGIYALGFLKRCARVLELDLAEIINQYKEESALLRQKERKSDSENQDKSVFERKRSFAVTPKMFSVFAVLLIFLSIFLFLAYQFKFLVEAPELILENPGDNFITSDKNLILKGRTEKGADLTVNGRRIEVSNEGNFYDRLELAAGLNVIEMRAVNKFGKISTLSRKIILNQ